MEEKLKQKHSDCIKIVLFGPESTGKTVISQALAKHYNTLWVPEYARLYAEEKAKNGKTLSKEDVLPIAKGQMALENKLSKLANRLLIYDTNLLETKVYSEIYYNGYSPEILKKFANENYYNLYFLTNIDMPWEADGIRDKPHNREKIFQIFQKTLISLNKPYVLLKGTIEERLEIAIEHIDRLLKEK